MFHYHVKISDKPPSINPKIAGGELLRGPWAYKQEDANPAAASSSGDPDHEPQSAHPPPPTSLSTKGF